MYVKKTVKNFFFEQKTQQEPFEKKKKSDK